MANTANRIVKNTFWLYGKMAITMFVSLYTTRLILATLGASDFGVYNIVGGTIAMLGFFNGALVGASQRFINYAEGEGDYSKKKVVFNVSFFLHLGMALFIGIILIIAGWFFFNGILNIPNDRLPAAIIVYGALVVSTVFSVTAVPYEALLNSHENMKYYSLVGVLESLLKLLVAFACVYSVFDKLILYGILMAIIPFITLTIMRIYCHKNYDECKINYFRYFDGKIAQEMGTFAGYNFLYSASSMITMQGMSILLNMFGGVIANAAHGIANQLAGQLMVFSNNMLKALNPVIVKSRGAGDNQTMITAAISGNKMSFIIYSIFAIPFIVECPYILSIWLKDVPEYSVLFVRLVLFRQLISQMMVTLDTCINATGMIKEFTIVTSIIWLTPLLIAYLMYKRGAPIETIYWLLIITAIIRIINAMFFCKKLCGLSRLFYVKEALIPCILTGGVLFFLLLSISCFVDKSFFRLFIDVIVITVVCPIFTYYIGFNRQERKLSLEMVIKLKKKIL